MSRLTSKGYWDSQWQDLERAAGFNYKKLGHRALHELFQQHLPLTEGCQILEAGAGDSIWMSYFLEKSGYVPYGLDYSRIGCEKTAGKWSGGGSCRIVCGDLFSPPFRGASFDIVYSIGVIEHFEDPLSALEAMLPLLNPGGILMTVVPNKTGLAGFTESVVNRENYDRHRPLTSMDLQAMYEKMELTEIQSGFFGEPKLIGRFPPNPNIATRGFGLLCKAISTYILKPAYENRLIAPKSRFLAAFAFAVGKRPLP